MPWVGGTITKGAIFDALTGGNCLAYWDWTLLTAIPANFLAITVNMQFYTWVQSALNMALTGGSGTLGSIFDQGAQIGTLNGQPMVAGSRLSVASGGNLIAHTANGQLMGSLDVQNSLNFANLASSNTNANVTALAGGGQSGATLLSGFYNRIATCATSLDSCILPGLTVAPVGTMVAVSNVGAATAAVYPDTGGAINGGSANASLSVPASKSAIFYRASPLLWMTIPFAPT
jgi:3D (Asp-Asp-Asp) domain-containing protein